jgi:hypothetical protein
MPEYPSLSQSVRPVHEPAIGGQDDRVSQVGLEDALGVMNVVPHSRTRLAVGPVDVVQVLYCLADSGAIWTGKSAAAFQSVSTFQTRISVSVPVEYV